MFSVMEDVVTGFDTLDKAEQIENVPVQAQEQLSALPPATLHYWSELVDQVHVIPWYSSS